MLKDSLKFFFISSLVLFSGAALAAEPVNPIEQSQEIQRQDKSEALSQLKTYMQLLEEDAKREGAIPFKKNDADFAEVVNHSQNLAENGNYSEAAKLLSGLITPNVAIDWKGMLEKRIAILHKWETAGAINLADYRVFYVNVGPEWFRERTKPMVSLWKVDYLPEAGKLFLIADLLGKRLSLRSNPADRQGQLIIAQAIPYLDKVEPQEAVSAHLTAGNLLHGIGKLDGAEKHWKQAMSGVAASPDWSKAVYNLGVLGKEKKLYAQAIECFHKILSARPNDKESSRNIMDPYRNYSHYSAMQISDCYEALGDYKNALKYVELAQTQYPYQSFDYNAAADSYIANRIKTLREKSAADDK